jgi:hypothetical protein
MNKQKLVTQKEEDLGITREWFAALCLIACLIAMPDEADTEQWALLAAPEPPVITFSRRRARSASLACDVSPWCLNALPNERVSSAL